MNFNLDNITWVWIDLDDTLIDFTTNAHTSLVKMWHDEPILQRLFPTPDNWAQRYEIHNIDLWSQYNIGKITREHLRLQRFLLPLTRAGLPHDQAITIAQRYDTLYLDYLAREKQLMPGAIDLLNHIQQAGKKIGILSNGFKEVQFRKIKTAGLDPWIDLVVLSDDIGINKPDPRIFAHAMHCASDTDPPHHLMIGDNPDTDIRGALDAHWSAIWYHPRRAFPNTQCPDGATEINELSQIQLSQKTTADLTHKHALKGC